MTDRYCALTVVLDKDYRDDDAESILSAIRMVKGVLSVEPHVSDITQVVAEGRARHDLREEIRKVLWE